MAPQGSVARAADLDRLTGLLMDKSERRGLLLGLIGVVIFGLTLPATRASLTGLDPWLIGFGRGVVAAVAAAIVLVATRQKWPPRHTWRSLVIASAGVVLGFPILATLAMQYVPASHGGIVLAILPPRNGSRRRHIGWGETFPRGLDVQHYRHGGGANLRLD